LGPTIPGTHDGRLRLLGSAIARTVRNGTLCLAATRAMARLSISTAPAPVVSFKCRFSLDRITGCSEPKTSDSMTGSPLPRTSISRRRHIGSHWNRDLSSPTTEAAITTVPGLSDGSNPPAIPKLTRPPHPSETRMRAALAARLASPPTQRILRVSRSPTLPKQSASRARPVMTPSRVTHIPYIVVLALDWLKFR